MKKIISIMLILASLASFASCGNGGNGNDTSADTSTSGTTTGETSADSTETNAPTSDVSAADIGKAVADEFGDEYVPDMDIDADILDATYGIKPEWYDDFFGQAPMINVNIDTFIAVKAKADKVSDVEKANACRVYTKGNYVFFIMLGYLTDEVESMDDADQLKYYTEQNDRAVKVIDSLLG